MNEPNAVELYRKYRPTKFSEMVGQDEAITTLNSMGKSGKIPGFILLTGPSGVGKTTCARILQDKLKVSQMDFREINAAKERGIDMVRNISDQLEYPPLGGKYRMFLIDEVQKTSDDAQSAFLKILEDIRDYNKFVFCTTDPQKLKNTIRTRATIITLKAVGNEDLEKLVKSVAEKENTELEEEVLDKIVEYAEGSPRKALVYLGQIIGISSEKRLDALTKSSPDRNSNEIAKALLDGVRWPTMAKILKGIDGLDEQAEGIRRKVLGYMKTVAIKSPNRAEEACLIIDEFRENFFDTKAAGLVLACYSYITGDRK